MKSGKMFLDVKIFLIICIVGSIVIISFLLMPKKATGRYTGAVNIISSSDTRSIETFNKSKNHYAIKLQEKDKYFLEVYGVGDSGKYTIDKDKFDSIHEGNYYWFYIKFIKPGESSSGSIERVYTANPLK